jgi:hypothetical protein
MYDITDEDAQEMYHILKDVVKNYEYDIDSCYEMRPPSGCKKCNATMRAREIIADIESQGD